MPYKDEAIRKAKAKEYSRACYLRNREKVLARQRELRATPEGRARQAAYQAAHTARNPEGTREYQREWGRKHKAARYTATMKWREKNAAKHRANKVRWQREKVRTSPQHAVAQSIRIRLGFALKGRTKPAKTADLVGCTWAELVAHIEAQFQPGMTWKNRGVRGWHIDHIRPLSWFDLTDEAQVRAACHYSNLQPMWASENCAKGARWEGKAA